MEVYDGALWPWCLGILRYSAAQKKYGDVNPTDLLTPNSSLAKLRLLHQAINPDVASSCRRGKAGPLSRQTGSFPLVSSERGLDSLRRTVWERLWSEASMAVWISCLQL